MRPSWQAFAKERRASVQSLASLFPFLIKALPPDQAKGWRQHEFITPSPSSLVPVDSAPQSPQMCNLAAAPCDKCLVLSQKLQAQEMLVQMLMEKRAAGRQ